MVVPAPLLVLSEVLFSEQVSDTMSILLTWISRVALALAFTSDCGIELALEPLALLWFDAISPLVLAPAEAILDSAPVTFTS